MRINQPSWELKNAVCKYCDQGELIFSKCPNCQAIVLVCAECSTVYSINGTTVGKEVGELNGNTKCTSCELANHSDFPLATAEDILAIGFTKNDYK